MEYAQARMKDFTKELEAKRPELPKTEEGKELTDEQKSLVNKVYQTESIAKIKKLRDYLRKRPNSSSMPTFSNQSSSHCQLRKLRLMRHLSKTLPIS